MHYTCRAAVPIYSLSRLDEAIAMIDFVVARDPVNATSHASLGQFYLSVGRWLPLLERIGNSPEQLAAINFEVTLPE